MCKESAQPGPEQTITPGKSLISNMKDERSSAFQKYLDIFVGERSIIAFLKYEMVISFMSMLPGALGFFLRSRLYKLVFKRIGKGVLFGHNLTIRCPGRISIGDNVILDDNLVLDAKGAPDVSYISLGDNIFIGRGGMLSCSNGYIKFGDSVSVGPNCKFITKNRIEIGSHVAIGQDVKVSGATHAFRDSGTSILEQERISRGVIVGDNVWIGIGATLLDGVTVGDDAIVGAGTVVSRDVEAGSVVLGNPARVVQKRQKAAQQ